MLSMVRTVLASSTMEPGMPARSESTWTFARSRTVGGDDEFHDAPSGRGRRVEHVGAGLGQRPGEGLDCPVAQARGDVTRLGVAVEYGVDHVVHRARADGVVRGVAHHLTPGQLEQPVGIHIWRLEQRTQGFGPALEFAVRRPLPAA